MAMLVGWQTERKFHQFVNDVYRDDLVSLEEQLSQHYLRFGNWDGVDAVVVRDQWGPFTRRSRGWLPVTLVDEDTDAERTYQIVGEPEANVESGRLNIKSPLARALIGKDEGDSVEVRTPGGEKSYEILKIAYI